MSSLPEGLADGLQKEDAAAVAELLVGYEDASRLSGQALGRWGHPRAWWEPHRPRRNSWCT